MGFLSPESRACQQLANFAGDQHAPVVPARAAKRNGQVAFTLGNIVRDQVIQQVRNALDEFLRLRKRADVASHARMLAGKILERGNVVRIGKEPNVEYQVAVRGYTVAVAEAVDLHQDSRLMFMVAEGVVDGFPKFMYVEFRGVDDRVRQAANRLHQLPLPAD